MGVGEPEATCPYGTPACDGGANSTLRCDRCAADYREQCERFERMCRDTGGEG